MSSYADVSGIVDLNDLCCFKNDLNVLKVLSTYGFSTWVVSTFKGNKITAKDVFLYRFCFSLLFWTDCGSGPKIEKSSLAGENRETLVSTKIRLPNDIAVDHTSKRLYWIDGYYDKLESIDLEGKQRKLLVQLKSHQRIIHPWSMAYLVDKNITFITDKQQDSLFEIDLTSSNAPDASFVFDNSEAGEYVGQVRVTNRNKYNGRLVLDSKFWCFQKN